MSVCGVCHVFVQLFLCCCCLSSFWFLCAACNLFCLSIRIAVNLSVHCQKLKSLNLSSCPDVTDSTCYNLGYVAKMLVEFFDMSVSV